MRSIGKTLPAPLDLIQTEVSRFIVQLLSEVHRKDKPQFTIDEIKANEAKEELVEESKENALDFKAVKQEQAKAQQNQPVFADFFLALPPALRREYESKREVLNRDFAAHLAEEFERILTPPKKLFNKNAPSMDTLELIDNETLTFRLALDNFASKINDHYKVAIALTCLRFEKVLGFEIDLLLSPLAPYAIGQAIEKSLSCLELDINEKKQLLMAILRGLIVQYGALLKCVNDAFVKKSILPRITDVDAKARIDKYLRKVKAQELGIDEPETNTAKSEGSGNETFARDFFEQVALPEGSQHQVAFNPNAALIPQAHLLQNIGSMKSVLVNTDEQSGYLMPVNQEATFSELLAEHSDLSEFALTAENSKTIGIVSMLFDTLKNEQGISAPIKALLLQLTIPLLKAAVQDDEFFSEKANPAQVLFNSIAEISATWTAESSVNNDFLYKKMSDIVNSVSDNYDNDYSVFESAVDDFESFVDTENQKTQRVEDRIVANETAKARIQAARKIAQDHIYMMFGDYILDEDFKQFLDVTWEQALFFIANSVIDIDESDLWHQAISIEQTLVNILEYESFDGTIDELLIDITKILAVSGRIEADVTAELDRIKKELQDMINEVADSSSTQEVAKPSKTAVKKTAEQKASAANDKDDAGITKLSREELANIQKVLEHISVGCWFEDRATDPASKVKLAAHIKFTDTFVFVNRKGVKAASYDGATLVGLMREKQLILVDNTMFYDRSMEKIIGELRS